MIAYAFFGKQRRGSLAWLWQSGRLTEKSASLAGPPQNGMSSGGKEEHACVQAALACSIIALVAVGQRNYLFFHGLAEIYCITVYWGVFFVAWSARRLIRNSYLCVLGVASLFVGFLSLLHMLAYRGMGVFADTGGNLPTQLWIAARILHALSFAAASLCLFAPRQDINAVLPAAGWGGLALLLTLLIFTGHFPACFVEGSGLTLFKKLSETAAVALFALAMLLAWMRHEQWDLSVLHMLSAALLLNMAAGIMFMQYISVYGKANLIGHLFGIGAAYILFRVFIRTGITAPQSLLFYELNRRQEELEQIKAGLEQQVQERTRNLDLKNKELEESNQRLDEFAYSISHDLREPLRGMHNFAHFLAEDYRGTIDAEGREMLDTIMRLAQRLDAQVLAILKYSRIGRLELQLQETDVDHLLDEVLEGLHGLIAAHHVRIERPRPLPPTVCHAEYVRLVFNNLISNGIIYNEQPEKELVVSWLDPGTPLPGTVLAKGSPVPVLLVRDNGIGIPEKHFQRIFGMFRRLHGQDKYGGGTGVGLAIARQVVERHGGLIFLESDPGKGTTFYFTLSAGGG